MKYILVYMSYLYSIIMLSFPKYVIHSFKKVAKIAFLIAPFKWLQRPNAAIVLRQKYISEYPRSFPE